MGCCLLGEVEVRVPTESNSQVYPQVLSLHFSFTHPHSSKLKQNSPEAAAAAKAMSPEPVVEPAEPETVPQALATDDPKKNPEFQKDEVVVEDVKEDEKDDDDDEDEKEDGIQEEVETPMRPMLCLNSKSSVDIKSIEEVEDCFILDFDPFESIDLTKLSVNINPSDAFAASDGTSDLCVIEEKGQVACRDYPHSRHLCVNFPFETTPHENYCKLCFCYVCDSAAPCKYWTDLKLAHCNASEHVGDWTYQRKLRKQTSAEFK